MNRTFALILILVLLTGCDRPLQTPIAKAQLQIGLSDTPTPTSTPIPASVLRRTYARTPVSGSTYTPVISPMYPPPPPATREPYPPPPAYTLMPVYPPPVTVTLPPVFTLVPTRTIVPTSTRTPTHPPIATFVLPPTAIPIWTRTPTATFAPPLTSTSSYTPTLTNTPTLTRTFTPTNATIGGPSITYTRTRTRTNTITNTPIPTITPTPTRTLAYPLPPQTFDVVKVSYNARYPFNNNLEVEVGQTVGLDVTFEAVSLTVVYRSDGKILSVSALPNPAIDIAQMRLCMGNESRCSDLGAWRSFEPSYATDIQVDWRGPRRLFLDAEFRDANGTTLLAYSGPFSKPGSVAQVEIKVNGIEKLPDPMLTSVAATRQAFPVTGSVLIENGREKAGGLVPALTPLWVQFQAVSPFGKVTEMRVGGANYCFSHTRLDNALWQPFVDARIYEVSHPIGYMRWVIFVQYRDASGNLSPVYCDDISLDGHYSPR